MLKDFETKVKERGFEVVQVQGGPASRPEIAPVVDGAPVSIEQLQAKADAGEITREEFDRIVAQQAELEAQMDIVMREMRNIERKAKKSLEDLNHKIVVPMVEELVEDLEERYTADKVQEYLVNVKKDVLEHLPRFHQKEEAHQNVLGHPAAQGGRRLHRVPGERDRRQQPTSRACRSSSRRTRGTRTSSARSSGSWTATASGGPISHRIKAGLDRQGGRRISS